MDPWGAYVFTPDFNYVGPAGFAFEVSNGSDSDEGYVSIEVTNASPNVLGNSETIRHDQALSSSVTAYDMDNDPLTFDLGMPPQNGSVAFSEGGAYVYTPAAGFVGFDSFEFRASDPFYAESTGTVSIHVTNSPPTAQDDSVSVAEGETVSGTLMASDSDGDTLTYSWASGPASGSVTIDEHGGFVYTPPAGFTGSDSFTFTVSDGVTTVTGTITIEVGQGGGGGGGGGGNSPPVAQNGDETVLHDRTLLALLNVFDADLLTFTVTVWTEHGTLSLDSTGSYTYTPNPGYVGDDAFSFEASDGQAAANGSVAITVYNTAPTAHDQTEFTFQNQPLWSFLGGTDPDGDLPLTFALAAGPWQGGVVSLGAEGSFTFTPLTDYVGQDGFLFSVSDGIDYDYGTVTINIGNHPPVASDAEPIFHWARDPDTTEVVNLWELFDDGDDPDSELMFSATSSDPAVVPTVDNATGELLLTFTGAAAQADVVVSGWDPHGVTDMTMIEVWSVDVADMLLERELPDSSWIEVPSNEVLWDDDSLRWTAAIAPPNTPAPNSLEWVKKPWEYRDDPSVPWETFAIGAGANSVEGNPGVGHWAVSPRVWFGAMFALLQQPQEVVVARIESVTWKAHDFGDGLSNYEEGGNPTRGDRIFPEVLEPTTNWALHDGIDVEVKTDRPIPAGYTATAFIKAFDPDYEGESAVDPNDDTGPTGNDNMGSGGALGAIGAELSATDIVFAAGETTKLAFLRITQPQPGNNVIVAGVGRHEWLDEYAFAADGITLLRSAGGESAPNHLRTANLTVWRTLNVEQDSMAAPTSPLDSFDGAGVGNDDVYPGDLGTQPFPSSTPNGSGDFVQPGLDFLISELARVHVRVRMLGVLTDVTDNADFVKNIASDAVSYLPGQSVRDIHSSSNFWAIQVFGAYEYQLQNDFDFVTGQTETARLGSTSTATDITVNVYLETIRDVSANISGAVPPSVIAARTVLHETVHRFGHVTHDSGPMLSQNNVFGADQDNKLSPLHMWAIVTSEGPKR